MQIVMLIAFSDSIASVFSALGFPPNHTVECSVQSFFFAFFYKASWMWILMLCHQMYHYLTTAKFGLNKYQMHSVCWIIPLMTTLLPLSEESYGTDDEQVGEGWCFLTNGKSHSETTTIWTFLSFDLVLCLSLGWIMYYVTRISLKYSSITNPKVSSIVHTLYLYPLSMLLAWLPNLVYFTFIQPFCAQSSNLYANTVILILSTQNGTFTAAIFFLVSNEARSRWSYVFKRLRACDAETRPPQSGDTIQVIYLQDNDVDDSVFRRDQRPVDGEWQGSDFTQSERSSSRAESISLSKLSSGIHSSQGRVSNGSKLLSSSPNATAIYGVSPTGQPIPILSSTPSSYARSSLFNRSPVQSYFSTQTEVGSYFNKTSSGIDQQSVNPNRDKTTDSAATVMENGNVPHKVDMGSVNSLGKLAAVPLLSTTSSNVSEATNEREVFSPVGRHITSEFEEINQMSSTF
jgi:hypothetical protein